MVNLVTWIIVLLEIQKKNIKFDSWSQVAKMVMLTNKKVELSILGNKHAVSLRTRLA